MNYDEFAFFNEQLAHMLRDGIPLEGALGQLCADMRRGALRGELETLAAELQRGVPLADALKGTRLPDLYVQMLRVGAAGNDLPGVLRMLADHYRQVGSVWTRLKGLMFYPVVVLLLALGLSLLLSLYLHPVFAVFTGTMDEMRVMQPTGFVALRTIQFLGPPIVLAVAMVLVIVLFAVPACRQWLRWRFSPFKDASLAQAASALSLLLRGGCSLRDALGMLRELERGTCAEVQLAQMEARLAEGHGRFAQIAGDGGVFPSLFVWVVENGGEDMAAGLDRAAEIYRTRAEHRTEMLLYGALPISILVLGAMLLTQMSSVMTHLVQFMQLMSNM